MRHRSSLFVFLVITAVVALGFNTTFVTGFYSGIWPTDWYDQLVKPDWAPSLNVLAVIWLAWYVVIAVAGWIVWRAQGLGLALFLWFVQLGLNVAWPYVLFERHRIDSAMDVIFALLFAVAAFIFVSWGLRKSASVLFGVYAGWIAYVAAFNLALLQANT